MHNHIRPEPLAQRPPNIFLPNVQEDAGKGPVFPWSRNLNSLAPPKNGNQSTEIVTCFMFLSHDFTMWNSHDCSRCFDDHCKQNTPSRAPGYPGYPGYPCPTVPPNHPTLCNPRHPLSPWHTSLLHFRLVQCRFMVVLKSLDLYSSWMVRYFD